MSWVDSTRTETVAGIKDFIEVLDGQQNGAAKSQPEVNENSATASRRRRRYDPRKLSVFIERCTWIVARNLFESISEEGRPRKFRSFTTQIRRNYVQLEFQNANNLIKLEVNTAEISGTTSACAIIALLLALNQNYIQLFRIHSVKAFPFLHEMETDVSSSRLADILQRRAYVDLRDWFKNEQKSIAVLFSKFKNEACSETSNGDNTESCLLTSSVNLIGSTPIHYAISVYVEAPDLLKCMLQVIQDYENRHHSDESLEHYQEPDWAVGDTNGFCVMALSIANNCPGAIKELAMSGCEILSSYTVLLPSKEKFTSCSIGISIAFNALDAFEALLDLKTGTTNWDICGRRPIHLAVEYGRLGVVRRLLELDGAVDLKDKSVIDYMYRVREDFSSLELNSDEGSDSTNLNGDSERDTENEDHGIGNEDLEEEPRWGQESEDNETDFEDEDDSGMDSQFLEISDLMALEQEMEEAGFEIHRDQSGNITARFRGRQEGDISASDREDSDLGSNLLHIACKHKQVAILCFLLTHVGNLFGVDDCRGDGMTPVHICARNNDVQSLELLLDVGNARIDVKNDILGMSAIHLACENAAKEALQYLLSKGENCDTFDDNQFVPLHYCATNDNAIHCLEILAEAGCNLDAQANDGETAIYTAISRWNLKMFWKLLEGSANPGIPHSDGTVVLGFIAANSMEELAKFAWFVSKNEWARRSTDMDMIVGDEGQTALHLATKESSLAAISALLDSGASPNVQDANGFTPLSLFLSRTHNRIRKAIRIVWLFLDKGADPNASNKLGMTPMHYACSAGISEIVKILIQKGADVQRPLRLKSPLLLATEKSDITSMENLLSAGADPDALDDNSTNPLLLCSKRHFIKGMKLLIQYGADVNIKDKAGNCGLHLCAERSGHEVSEVIDILHRSGCSLEEVNSEGDQPIQVHLQKRRTEGVRALIQAGCNVNSFSKSDQTPLMTACDRGHIEGVRILIRCNADVNLRNTCQHTAIFYFADDERTTIRILRLLIRSGADLTHKDKDGDTVLHEAALGNNPTIVRFLMHKGIDINSRNKLQETALFQAAKNGFVETVEILLAENSALLSADPKIANKSGVSPYQIARSAGHSEVMHLILRSMRVTLSTFAPISTYRSGSPARSGNISQDGIRTRCAVCQDNLRSGEEIRILPCGHEFHDPCILPWIGGENLSQNTTCPVCKQPVAPDNI